MKTLLKITGSPDCISDTARLHYYKGEKDEVSGYKALLTADSDSRPSYFLSAAQKRELLESEKIFDTETAIHFYKTDFRLDNPFQFKRLFAQNKDEREIVFFTHEWLLQVRPRRNVILWAWALIKRQMIFSHLEKVCAYAKKENLKFAINAGDFYE